MPITRDRANIIIDSTVNQSVTTLRYNVDNQNLKVYDICNGISTLLITKTLTDVSTDLGVPINDIETNIKSIWYEAKCYINNNTNTISDEIITLQTNAYQDLTLTNDLLGLSNSSVTINLADYIDPPQDLTLTGNLLSLTNSTIDIDLSSYIDPPQDLTLTGNLLSLTNSTIDIDLSSYIDPPQTLSFNTTTNDLSISGGNTENLSSISLWEKAGTYSLIQKGVPNDNILLGTNAGNSITSGSGNVGLGKNAVFSNTSGSYNYALGDHALYDNTTGSNNFGLGYYTLEKNVNGANNVAIGYLAARFNISGLSNVSIGTLAGTSSTTASQVVAIGEQALRYSLGSQNTAVGWYAGQGVIGSTTGVFNTFVGRGAGTKFTTSNYNTALGYRTLENTSTGGSNTAIGGFAGFSNLTGIGNVFLGYRSGYNELLSNKLYISNSDTTTPLIYGEFDNSLARVNGDLEVVSTGYVLTPVGTTLERPTGATGMVRFNSTDVNFEGYDGTNWVSFGGSSGDPNQTLSFADPNLTISGTGGNSVDISNINHWSFDGTGNRYLLEDVYVGVNGGNIYSFRADLLTRLQNLYLTGTLSDSTNSTGTEGDVLTRSAGGGVEWTNTSVNTAASFTGNDTTLSGAGASDIQIDGPSTTIAITSTGTYLLMVTAHFYSQTGGLIQCSFTLKVNGVIIDTVQLDSDPQEYQIALHGVGLFTSGHSITITADRTGNAQVVSPKVSYIKLIT